MLAEAERCYRRALSYDPDYAEAHKGLGLVAYKLGDRALATQEFKKYLSLRPEAEDYGQVENYLIELGATRLPKRARMVTKDVAVSPQAFSYRNVKFVPKRAGVQVIGEITNRSGMDLRKATFLLSLYDMRRRLLGVEEITINGFEDGQTRSFAILSDAAFDEIADHKIEYDSGS